MRTFEPRYVTGYGTSDTVTLNNINVAAFCGSGLAHVHVQLISCLTLSVGNKYYEDVLIGHANEKHVTI